MSTHHANAAHANQAHTENVHPAAELAGNAQAAAEQAARPEIPAPEHQNESQMAPANDAARPPIKTENILPPEVKLPEPKPEPTHINAPADAPTLGNAEIPQNVYVLPQVFEEAKVKLFSSILPAIEKANPHLTEGLSLELTNELTDPSSNHGTSLKVTLHGRQITANYSLIAKTVNDALLEHAVLGPVLRGDKAHTMDHMTYPDGSSELQLVIPGLSLAQYAQLVQSLAGAHPAVAPQSHGHAAIATPEVAAEMAATAAAHVANDPLTQVAAPVAAHETLVNPSQAVSI